MEIHTPLTESDTVPQGDTMLVPKESTNSRFHLQNPKGVYDLGDAQSLMTNMEIMKNIEADHSMIPETQMDSTKYWVKSKAHKVLTKVFGRGRNRPAMGASQIDMSPNTNDSRKFGGVMSVTIGNLCGRVKETGSDSMGRWVFTKFNRSGGGTITIVTTYHVNDGNPRLATAGKSTALMQQYQALRLEGREEPHKVRRHHTQDLLKFVKKCQHAGEKVCVGGDFNMIIGEGTDGMNKLCTQCNLIDAYFHKHGNQNFRTHEFGSKVIDYFLIDPELAPSIKRVGYEPFNANIQSDHRGLFVDVDTELFFGSLTIPLAPLSCRDLQSKKSRHIKPYFQEKHKQYEYHRWGNMITQLQACIDNDTPNHDLVETADNRRTRSCKTAARKLAQYPKEPYSPALRRMRDIDNLLRMELHQRSSDTDYSNTIEKLRARIGGIPITVPENTQALTKYHRAHVKTFKKMVREEMKTGDLRIQHQNDLIAQYSADGNHKQAKILQRMQRAHWG